MSITSSASQSVAILPRVDKQQRCAWRCEAVHPRGPAEEKLGRLPQRTCPPFYYVPYVCWTSSRASGVQLSGENGIRGIWVGGRRSHPVQKAGAGAGAVRHWLSKWRRAARRRRAARETRAIGAEVHTALVPFVRCIHNVISLLLSSLL